MARVKVAVGLTGTIALTGSLGSEVVFAPSAQASPIARKITFTSQRATAALLAHYVVTPALAPPAAAARAASAPSSPSVSDRDRPRLAPKHPGRLGSTAVIAPSGSATPSDGTVSGTAPVGTPLRRSFIGQQGSHQTCSYFAHGCNPPDMAVAASPHAVLQGVNTQWEVLDTRGHVQPGSRVGAQQFFGVPDVSNPDGSPCDIAHQSQPFLSDPRALYDPADGRFWAAMLQVEGGLGIAPDCPTKSVYYIAVSQTSDPTDAWNVYEFDMAGGTTFAADFTQIGVNSDAVFFSANMFNNVGPGFYAEVFEANKAQMEHGQSSFTADGFLNLEATGPGTTAQTGPFLADTVQPVLDLNQNTGDAAGPRTSASAGGADGLFVDTIDGPDLLNGNFCTSAADACKGLAFWRMRNPIAHDHGGPAPTLTGTYVPDTKPFYFPPAADQPSCAQCIDASDLRISATPVLRGGTVYAAWETGLNNSTQVVPAIEWGQIRLAGSKPTGSTSGYFNFTGDTAAAYGALMPDASGNLVMVYERMGNTVLPEVRFTVRRAGDKNFTDSGQLLKAGEAPYRPTLCGTADLPVCRWGDYEATSFDGQGRIWIAGEYANTHTDPSTAPWFGRNWGTWIGAIDTSDDNSQT